MPNVPRDVQIRHSHPQSMRKSGVLCMCIWKKIKFFHTSTRSSTSKRSFSVTSDGKSQTFFLFFNIFVISVPVCASPCFDLSFVTGGISATDTSTQSSIQLSVLSMKEKNTRNKEASAKSRRQKRVRGHFFVPISFRIFRDEACRSLSWTSPLSRQPM